ncbi:hypothetical protein PVAP13_9NG069788 [Panicum virgatum]|uniref:Uncharacterized protein n=1 Tax=Panicum virgatum TaxID=38727 RepID=A0A8T0MEQ2_PANVG|nr:hypothetical protein PVAP13_9NG069788 [Panicum virgatum]
MCSNECHSFFNFFLKKECHWFELPQRVQASEHESRLHVECRGLGSLRSTSTDRSRTPGTATRRLHPSCDCEAATSLSPRRTSVPTQGTNLCASDHKSIKGM